MTTGKHKRPSRSEGELRVAAFATFRKIPHNAPSATGQYNGPPKRKTKLIHGKQVDVRDLR